MKPSRYNLYIDRGDKVRIVGLLTGSVVDVRPTVASSLKAGSADIIDEDLRSALTAALLLVPDSFDELRFLLQRSSAARHSADQLSLIVVPTLGCNLNCHYCFEAKRDERLERSAIAAVGTAMEERIDRYGGLHVQWFGGEPLQAPVQIGELSARLRALCERSGKPYAAEIVTNGVLLSAEMARDLAGWGVETAQVTFDGARRLHDKVRFGAGRKPTFDTIAANILEASESLRVKIRVHVAPYSIASAAELLDELAELNINAAADCIYFAPLFNYRQDGPSRPFDANDRRFLSAADFAEAQVQLLERAWALGFRTPDPLAATHGICAAASSNSIVVNADGSLTKCYMDVGDRTEIVGNVDRFAKALDAPSKWTSYEIADEECRSCTFLPVCLGGCPKQKMARADKAVICTPLRYNHQAVLRDHQWRSGADVN